MDWSILVSIFLFYAILVGLNIPASFLGIEFERDSKPKLWYQPPGFVIPIIWFVLFAMLALSRHHLLQIGHDELQWPLFILAFICAAYAYYTIGLSKVTGISVSWLGLAGNMIVILFAGYTTYVIYPESIFSALLVVPTILWTALASLIIVGEMKLKKDTPPTAGHH
ncbi:TspO/MBR family protein [Gracilimonas sp.]|uniref:TspO/MBR family protein n=1 Tax=Gracilimonas sp. TaxID=1974203 RepID=UPI0032EF1E23